MLSIFLQIELLILLWVTLSLTISVANPFPIAKHGCADNCGNVSIPYPFGVGPNCYHNSWYEIVCNKSFSPNKPFLSGLFNLEVMEISMFSEDELEAFITVGIAALNICADSKPLSSSIDLRPSPYRFGPGNAFVVEGCGGSVLLRNRSKDVLAGCASFCPKNNNHPTGRPADTNNCFGVGCCQTSFDSGRDFLDFYEIGFHEKAVPDHHTCMLAGLTGNPSTSLPSANLFPTQLTWTAKDLALKSLSYGNTFCFDYTCTCTRFSEGNPYLPHGCKAVKGCGKCGPSHCVHHGNGDFHCNNKAWITVVPILGASVGAGSILLIVGFYGLYRQVKKRKEIKQRAKFFKRNGGLLLQQQMSSTEGVVQTTKIFTIKELEKATDNFNENRILGQGGQGTVYKGMLMDGMVVAIKRSKQVDENQLEQFINEVFILSQINHRNVVKLLGCCLETEVPLLVYEFIPNGALAQHIHHPREEFQITWKMRLQIAAESAGALTYLHSSSSTPIYHRDIKSTNILLDDKYRAKVSDFGTSRTIAIDKTHLTTCVLGTFGYLDPEYFQSNQFTEKSDVYSFGVVLVELLTGKKPIYASKSGEQTSLATEFLLMMGTSSLSDILDDRVLHEAKEGEIYAVAKLAKKCLNLNGKLRPTMKEVAMVLDGVRSSQVPILESTSPDGKFMDSEISKGNSAPLCSSSISLEEWGVFSIDSQALLVNTL